MRYKPFALRGAALAAIAGGVLAVTPAVAQLNPDFTGKTNNMSSDQAGQPVDQVTNPTSTLATDNVQDSTGQTIGTVRSVTTGPDGRASRINVSLTRSGRSVWIRARELRFDPASNTVKSSLTLSQIRSMPATPAPSTESP